ncbi:DUF6174 domain-containing protein [Psychrosphaera haliotis]|uniref:Lipoprotein n=1 Tax=Psychrosphaera haliotis TaxID=555083 RepID=A0A6N8FCF8_9GAMM|nr:DUF6174 domain-containing protein [Psychrosphaera haliotis]MUH73229.1 hypothetical protein [Psychrosphaera haliotis]
MKLIMLISFLSCLTLSACSSDSNDNSDLLSVIEMNQKIWMSSGIESYTFTYQNLPNDCPTADALPAVEITVEDNSITKVYEIDSGNNLPLENNNYPTILALFEQMKSAINSIEGEPSFDSRLGYPTKYSTDKSSADCDGYTISVYSFI